MSPSPEGQPPPPLRLVSDDTGVRLDRYLAGRYPHLSRSYLQKLIADGRVTVNGRPVRPSLEVKEGDSITISLPPPPSPQMEPEPMPLRVMYEDEEVLVVDKPAGLPTHPGAGHSDHTLANALLAYRPSLRGIGDPDRPGLVHRLDKDTSGLVMVAKTEQTLRALSGQLKDHSIKKRYIALVKGRVEPPEGVIEAPIGRSPRQRKKMAVVRGGREAVTRYKVLQLFDGYTLLEVAPETGRTHQIRVHLAAIGHPVMGDAAYGSRHPGLNRHFLHASFLGFRLPGDGRYIEVRSELPAELQTALEALSPDSPDPSV